MTRRPAALNKHTKAIDPVTAWMETLNFSNLKLSKDKERVKVDNFTKRKVIILKMQK